MGNHDNKIMDIEKSDEFHLIFKSVPHNERLICSYSCALSREILLHGRMYITARQIYFSSNILGWSTNVF